MGRTINMSIEHISNTPFLPLKYLSLATLVCIAAIACGHENAYESQTGIEGIQNEVGPSTLDALRHVDSNTLPGKNMLGNISDSDPAEEASESTFVKSNVMNGHVVIMAAADSAVSAPRVRLAVPRAYAKCQRLIASRNVVVKHAAMMDVEVSAVIVLMAHPAWTLVVHKSITQPDSASLTTMRQIMHLLARRMNR